jgi:hypothetical protein
MDPDIYKLLPSGGDLWKNKHANADIYLQNTIPTVTPVAEDTVMANVTANVAAEIISETVVTHVTPVAPVKKKIKTPSLKFESDPVSVVAGTPMPVTPVTLNHEKENHEGNHEGNQGGNQDFPLQYEVFEYILMKIDEVYSIYPKSLKENASSLLKNKLEKIVTSVDGLVFFGPRKTRSIIAWLSGNSITDTSEPIIAGFLSWILDEIIISDKKKIHSSIEYNWILYKNEVKRGKERRQNVWMIKK